MVSLKVTSKLIFVQNFLLTPEKKFEEEESFLSQFSLVSACLTDRK